MARDLTSNIRRALDPTTPVTELTRFAASANVAEREAAAWCPRTPLADLRGLARDAHESVAGTATCNPAFSDEEQSELFRALPAEVQLALAGTRFLPVAILRYLATVEPWDSRLGRRADALERFAKRTDLPDDVEQRLRDMVGAADGFRLGFALLGRPAPDVQTLTLLVERGASGLRSEVARHAGTPVSLLERLATDEPQVRGAVAANPRAPRSILEALARDEDVIVRAMHPWTTADDLETLAHVDSALSRVIEHPSISRETLEWLAGHRKVERRRAAASCVYCPPDLLQKLLGDRDSATVHRVQGNPAAHRAGIVQPVGGVYEATHAVLAATTDHGDVLDRCIASSSLHVRLATIANPHLTPSQARTLSRDVHPSVRRAVASSPVLEEEARAILRTDPEVGRVPFVYGAGCDAEDCIAAMADDDERARAAGRERWFAAHGTRLASSEPSEARRRASSRDGGSAKRGTDGM